VIVHCYSREDWKAVSEAAHLVCFGERKEVSMDRIDFALVVGENDAPSGYVTCREHDAETLYWQFGGAFPGTRSTSLSWKGYQALVDWCKTRYKRITTLIENTNIVMLKMAMKVGFRIQGVRVFKGQILVEHLLEFSC
jgi:RimJ/RimL family protein N-acetyltransferase